MFYAAQLTSNGLKLALEWPLKAMKERQRTITFGSKTFNAIHVQKAKTKRSYIRTTSTKVYEQRLEAQKEKKRTKDQQTCQLFKANGQQTERLYQDESKFREQTNTQFVSSVQLAFELDSTVQACRQLELDVVALQSPIQVTGKQMHAIE